MRLAQGNCNSFFKGYNAQNKDEFVTQKNTENAVIYEAKKGVNDCIRAWWNIA